MVAGVSGQLVSSADLADWSVTVSMDPSRLEAHRALRSWRRECGDLGPASSLRSMAEIGGVGLTRVLGFVSAAAPVATSPTVLDLAAQGSRVPCLVLPWADGMDRYWRDAALAGRRARSRWVLLFNGTHLRLLDALRAPARRWLEFDLDLVADVLESFDVLWACARADMLTVMPAGAAVPLDPLIEQADVRAVLVSRSLRDGVLSASGDVLTAMIGGDGPHDLAVAFEQSLTVVYRILFLLFAEARGLVPMWHPVYKASYSIDSLRLLAERGRAAGLWDALRAMCRLAHAGCRVGDLKVTPFNGRLFDGSRAPLVERRNLDDQAASRAVLALSTGISRTRGRERIAYRDLGVEQLGAVYETLLDYQPCARRSTKGDTSRAPVAVSLERGSGARKATGSFYTPEPIARYLVRQTLGPLVSDRTPDEILMLKVVDPAMGSGAFLVAACRFLADAYTGALVGSGACRFDEIGPAERTVMHRLVAERCLFGVDLNPMAVQLARLSLWLATLARDRPLSFLDHHIRTGDSLIGAWLSSLAHPVAGPARRRRDTQTRPLFEDDEIQGIARQVLPLRLALAGPNETIDEVRAKERTLAGLERPDSKLARWKQVADLWCAQWLRGAGSSRFSIFRALADVVLGGQSVLPGHIASRELDECRQIAAVHRFFHWELEFPEVFFDSDGQRLADAGFDAVIGNPPWDMMRSDIGSVGDRARARTAIERALRFTRDAGIYEAQSRGHANRYQLFLERSIALLRRSGRLGLVLPGGFASDHGSAAVRRRLFSQCAVDGLVGFDNRRRVFPIHRSVRFMLVTAEKGTATDRFGVRLGEVDPGVLDEADSGRPDFFPLQISADLLARVSGDGLALPAVLGPVDVAITERAAALFPPLGSSQGWGVKFGRELNATDDRDVLTAERGLPVVGGRLLEPFAVRLHDAAHRVRERDATRLLGDRWRRPRLAYRDVASSTNRLTLIAAVLPAGCVSTHTVFCLRTRVPLQLQFALCGLLNSLVVNYLVRLRVTTHVNAAIVERLPLPAPSDRPAALREIAALAHGLSRRWHHDWLARLHAAVAMLYQLSEDEFAHVLTTFPLVEPAERDRALSAFRIWPGVRRRAASAPRTGPT